jgi:hypothetical protein
VTEYMQANSSSSITDTRPSAQTTCRPMLRHLAAAQGVHSPPRARASKEAAELAAPQQVLALLAVLVQKHEY